MPVMFNGAFPLLVRVAVCAAPAVPTVWEVNVSVVGLRLAAGPIAVPTNSADWGLPGSVPLIEILAVLAPPVVGVNVTLTVQAPPAASDAPQLLVCVKSELAGPARLIAVMFNPEFPVLISMIDVGVLPVPTACGGKIAWAGLTVSAGPVTPVPLRGMAPGLDLVLSLNVMEPEFNPVAAGEKLTVIVQWAPAARLAPQSLVWLKFPLTAILVRLKPTLAGLLMVTVCGVLVVPTPCDPKLSEPGAMALKAVLSSTAISFAAVL